MEVRSRLDLSHQAEQAVHQRNGVMGRSGLPVVAVTRFVRLLVLLDAQGRTVKDRGEDERDRFSCSSPSRSQDPHDSALASFWEERP